MAEVKITRTYRKLYLKPEVIAAVREWAGGKGVSFHEDQDLVKMVGAPADAEALAETLKRAGYETPKEF